MFLYSFYVCISAVMTALDRYLYTYYMYTWCCFYHSLYINTCYIYIFQRWWPLVKNSTYRSTVITAKITQVFFPLHLLLSKLVRRLLVLTMDDFPPIPLGKAEPCLIPMWPPIWHLLSIWVHWLHPVVTVIPWLLPMLLHLRVVLLHLVLMLLHLGRRHHLMLHLLGILLHHLGLMLLHLLLMQQGLMLLHLWLRQQGLMLLHLERLHLLMLLHPDVADAAGADASGAASADAVASVAGAARADASGAASADAVASVADAARADASGAASADAVASVADAAGPDAVASSAGPWVLHAVVPLLAVPWPVAQPRLAAFVVHTGDVSHSVLEPLVQGVVVVQLLLDFRFVVRLLLDFILVCVVFLLFDWSCCELWSWSHKHDLCFFPGGAFLGLFIAMRLHIRVRASTLILQARLWTSFLQTLVHFIFCWGLHFIQVGLLTWWLLLFDWLGQRLFSPGSRIEKDGGFHLSRFGDPHHRAARSLQKLMPTPAEPAPRPMLRRIPWQAHRVQVLLKIGNIYIYGKLRILIERQRLFFKSQWWAISNFCICGVCAALRGAARLIPIWIWQVKTYIWSANSNNQKQFIRNTSKLSEQHIQWDGNDRGQTESKHSYCISCSSRGHCRTLVSKCIHIDICFLLTWNDARWWPAFPLSPGMSWTVMTVLGNLPVTTFFAKSLALDCV